MTLPPPSAPRVSVILPTYNRERLLPRAVDSVLAQTLGDFELLLVDDGSRDGTAEMVAARYGHDPRLRYLRKENGGTASARNHGLNQARGSLVAFLDSDDLWLPGYLASQAAWLELNPQAGLVVADARYEGPWGRAAPTVFADPDWHPPTSLLGMLEGGWAIPSSCCFRRASLGALRFRSDYRFSEDTELLFQFFAAGGAAVLNPEVLTIYVKHDGSSGEAQKMAQRLGFAEDHLRMVLAYRDRVSFTRAMGERLYTLHREMARRLLEQSRWAEAVPHLERWVRARYWRLGPRLLLWKARREARRAAQA